MVPAVPDQTAGELEQREVVLCFLIMADQNGSALAQPCQCTLYHLAAGAMPWLLLLVQFLLTNPPDVGCVPKVGGTFG